MHVTLNNSATGAVVAQAGTEVADIEAILPAVRSLAMTLRRSMGEDRSRDTGQALERVTTDSLDALREYSAGIALVNERQWAGAELRLAAAVRHDPAFASALIFLAHCQHNQRKSDSEWLPPARRAFELSAGLPSRERYFIEGSYYHLIDDLERAVLAYEALLREYPNDYWSLNNLASALMRS